MCNDFIVLIQRAHSVLPLVPKLPSEHWIMEEVQEVSRKKQEAYLWLTKDSDDAALKTNYQQLKFKYKNVVDNVREMWWSAKVEKAECM